MKNIIYILVLVSFTVTNTCMAASRSTQQVTITSEPSGADIYIGSQHQGTTPRSFSLQHNRAYRVIVQQNGYGAQYVDLRSSKNNSWKNKKNAYFGLCPIGGAAIGAGTGFVLTGGSLVDLGAFIVGCATVIGLATGIAIGLVGLGTNVYSESKKQRFPKRVHFTLQRDVANSH